MFTEAANGIGTQRCRATHGRIPDVGSRTEDGDERHGIRCSAELDDVWPKTLIFARVDFDGPQESFE